MRHVYGPDQGVEVRLTFVPDTSLRQVIEVYKGKAVRVGSAVVCPAGMPDEPVQIDNDVVLRELLRLDVSDHDEVYGFVQQFGDPGRGVRVSLDDLGAELARVRAMTRFWMMSLVPGEASRLVDAWTDEGFDCTTLDEALRLFSKGYGDNTAGTRSMTVTKYDDDGKPLWTVGNRGHGLVAALTLQLHNLMVLGKVPKKCGNERCDNLVVQKRDEYAKNRRKAHGSKGTSVRTGDTKFCRQGCAVMQNRRDRNRRAGSS